MGMQVGSTTNPYKTRRELKDAYGNTVATVTMNSISAAKKKNAKKKKLNYNYKKISKQITMNNTSTGARRVITKAREEVVSLLRKQMSGKYDETDLRHAIIHARKMERIARRKKKHLEEEEKAKATGRGLVENGASSDEDEEMKKLEESMENLSEEEMEQLEELMEEYEKLMQEMEETGGVNDLMKEYAGVSEQEMTPEEVDNLRKKHRADEMKDIVEADMKYLKALFNKLEREKQEGAQSDISQAVSLEIQGMDIPIPAEMGESAAELVGANMDEMA